MGTTQLHRMDYTEAHNYINETLTCDFLYEFAHICILAGNMLHEILYLYNCLTQLQEFSRDTKCDRL